MVLCCTVDFEQIERITIIKYALNIVIQKRKIMAIEHPRFTLLYCH